MYLNTFHVMADWYDKLISLLGLGECRTERLVGVVEREVAGLEALRAGRGVRAGVHRLPDGRRVLMLRLAQSRGDLGWPIPCSRGNAEVLGGFLARARAHLGPPSDSNAGWLQELQSWLRPRPPLEIMPPLPHAHLDCRIELRLVAPAVGGPVLELWAHGPRVRAHRSWRWSAAVAGSWQQLLTAVQTDGGDWAPAPS